MTNAIVIKGLTKTFGPKVAVNNLDLTIPNGCLCGFIGPNGAGKTTTIRMIMSIIFPDSGELSVLGKPSAVESKDRIGYLPEERGLYRKMRVLPFLVYMGRLKGVDSKGLKQKAMGWLERVDLAKEARKRCMELSKGMQQKVQFIATILHEPDLLILDEPFSGLDPVNRRLLRELLDEQHKAGRTIIFSTHAMYEAEQLCDRIMMIHNGVKVLDSSLEEIQARFDPRTIVAEPTTNGEATMSAIRAVHGVREVDRTREGLVIRVDEGTDPTRVLAHLAQAAPMRRVELKRVTLDEVFITLVEQSGQTAPGRHEIGGDGEAAGAAAHGAPAQGGAR